MTGALTTAIRLEDRPRRWLTYFVGHPQCVEHQFSRHLVCHCPPDDPAAEQIEHQPHVGPALTCSQIRNIRQPDLTRYFGMRSLFGRRNAAEILSEQVRRNRQRMHRIGRHFEFPARFNLQPHRPHQRLNSIEAAGVTVTLTHHFVEARRNVPTAIVVKRLADVYAQPFALLLAH